MYQWSVGIPELALIASVANMMQIGMSFFFGSGVAELFVCDPHKGHHPLNLFSTISPSKLYLIKYNEVKSRFTTCATNEKGVPISFMLIYFTSHHLQYG